MNEITKHNFETFGKLVREHLPKLGIFEYYPYGKEKKFKHWLGSCEDLSNLCNDKFYRDMYKEKSCEQLVYGIVEEVARAMDYLTVYGTHPNFDQQRIEAFALWYLFHRGIIGWRKDIAKGKTLNQIIQLEKKHKLRYDLVTANGKFADKNTENYIHSLTPSERKKQKEAEKRLKESNRKKHGVYTVDVFPLTQYSNATSEQPKILYTKQELCAIYHYVICAFENLC